MYPRTLIFSLSLLFACVGEDKDTETETETETEVDPNLDDPTESESETESGSETETETESGTETETDTDCTEYATGYADDDGDGWGDPDNLVEYCADSPPSGVVDNSMDCDDSDAYEPVWVDDDASSGGSGTFSSPMQTIQDGIDAADVCVYVMEGSYGEDLDFTGKDLLVWGVDGAESTLVEGTGDNPVVSFTSGESSDAWFTGFTLTGGGGYLESSTTTWTCGSSATCEETYDRYYGGGIFVDSAEPTLSDLILETQSLPEYSVTEIDDYTTEYIVSYGGGLAVTNGAASLENVWIEGPSATYGAGLYISTSSSVEAQQLWVSDTEGDHGAGAMVVGDLTAENAVFCGNTSSTSGALFVEGGSLDLLFATVVGAVADTTLEASDSAFVSANSVVFTESSGGTEVTVSDGSSVVRMEYSDVYPDTWDGMTSLVGVSGVISEDADFTSWSGSCASADLTPASTSPLVDAGDPGESDADGSDADIGAYGGPNGSW